MTDTQQAPIVVERTYGATLEEVWALWTTKDGFKSWWGPEGFRVAVHVLEPRAGGALDYDMIADSAEAIAAMKQAGFAPSHATHGRFAEFRPMERLSLVHEIDFLPGVAPYETTIEVAFQRLGEAVRMVVTLHPHRDPHWTKASAEGFASQIGKLDRRFGAAGR